MILFPAIDLKDGKCVRLYQGDMEKATIFNTSPLDQAKVFEKEGAKWLHIVDLDGAFAGKPVNIAIVRDILQNTKMNVQLGGGIRNIEAIQEWINAGVKRVILGTVAVKNPDIVRKACQLFPGRIAVGIDAKEGFVATEGWAEKSSVSVVELAKKFEYDGVSCIIYTDISKDGTMQGADLDGTKDLASSINIPVIISGGISSLKDLKKAKKLEEHGIIGVISGRAIYEKAFTVSEGIKALS